MMLALFLLGVSLTFVGVFILGSGKSSSHGMPRESLGSTLLHDDGAAGRERSTSNATTSSMGSFALRVSRAVTGDFAAPQSIAKELHESSFKWVHLHPNAFHSERHLTASVGDPSTLSRVGDCSGAAAEHTPPLVGA